jgi:hypothetical protein
MFSTGISGRLWSHDRNSWSKWYLSNPHEHLSNVSSLSSPYLGEACTEDINEKSRNGRGGKEVLIGK